MVISLICPTELVYIELRSAAASDITPRLGEEDEERLRSQSGYIRMANSLICPTELVYIDLRHLMTVYCCSLLHHSSPV